jgi:hypothetical protein
MPRTSKESYKCDWCGVESGWIDYLPITWSRWHNLNPRHSFVAGRAEIVRTEMYLCPTCTPTWLP